MRDAINSPLPLRPGGPPIMVGGQGEKVTFRIAAQYADMLNTTAGLDEIPRKLEALAGHCQRLGRDFGAINKTPLASLVIGDTMEDAEAKRNGFLAARGLDWNALDDATRAMVGARIVAGDADTVAEKVCDLLALGLDGFVCNMPADGWIPEAVARAGEVLGRVIPT